jgi:hypothetical protein
VKTRHKLERALLLQFMDEYGSVPHCNTVGKNMAWTDELNYFTTARLSTILDALRIGGQHAQYLQASLRGHAGSRPGYTQAITATVSQIPPEDLDTLAYYAARFSGPAAALTGK